MSIAQDQGTEQQSLSDRGEVVLVVEDNRLNSLLMSEQLRILGFAAEFVTSGSEALHHWRGGACSAILTDIQMPGMDGFELAQVIRAEEREGARIPIIALTANAQSEKPARWRSAGIDDYLTKPAELATLKSTLEYWLRKPAPAAAPAHEMASLRDPAKNCVDLRVLARLVGNDPVVIADFLHAFTRSAKAASIALEAAMSSADAARAGALAHQLKASAAAIGAQALSSLCATLETSAARNDRAAQESAWIAVRPEITDVVRWIEHHQREGASSREAPR